MVNIQISKPTNENVSGINFNEGLLQTLKISAANDTKNSIMRY